MTKGMTKRNGTIIGSESVLNGYEKWGPCISNYHKSNSDKIVLKHGVVNKLDNCTIKGTRTSHGDPTGSGFQIDYNGFKVSYTSDTGYFEGLADDHKGADILIASVLRPGNKSIPGHMCSRNFIDLINEVEPKVAVMTHLGLKMISSNPVTEAKKVSKKTGVKTIAAFDGLSFNVNYNNPKRFRLISLKDVQSSVHSTSHTLYESEKKNSYQLAFKHQEFDELAIVKKETNQSSKFDG